MQHRHAGGPAAAKPGGKTLPPPLPGFLRARDSGATVAVKVQPRASRNEIGPLEGEELRVWVTAPPVDSAANDALIRLLAERLGCPKGSLQIQQGQSSRHKVICVAGWAAENVLRRLSAARPGP
ncbi:MAG TPA: DUF167 domain-containing protein [Candidatus Paceibacterota bacterium]|nr:DUF167 domain-containing protein [Verrucomicrobiota bacterium]HOX02423.1 DUF167 domain-containing protein [Verrucomicrobiota bacterium]HRZ45184.1 DUF167 domain-containing protein [Candidatus Paceibacterota bacterium]